MRRADIWPPSTRYANDFPPVNYPKIPVRLGNWDEALEMLGEVNLFRDKENVPRMTIFALILLIRLIVCVLQCLS